MTSEFQTWTVTEPYLHINCNLGEGPHYEPATNTLRFVDIVEKALHSVSLSEGPSSLKSTTFPFSVGSTADIEGVDPSKKILVGSKSGVGILDRETGELELLKKYYDGEDSIEKAEVLGEGVKEERMRGNDGSVDPSGRFWVGTMTDFWVGDVFDEGTLFRFDSDASRHSLVHPVKIPNSIGWSLDHLTLYFTHSSSRVILAYDYTESTGDITNGRPFYNHEGPGEPDGFKVDVEGNLWSAVYGEGKVLKINNKGKLVGEILFPAKCITCPVFVGTELFVTSASGGRESEFAGDVFRVDVGTTGVEPFQFKIAEGVSKTLSS